MLLFPESNSQSHALVSLFAICSRSSQLLANAGANILIIFELSTFFYNFNASTSLVERICGEFCCFEGWKSVEMVPVNALQMLIFGAQRPEGRSKV